MKHTVLLAFALSAFSALAQSSPVPGSSPAYPPQPYSNTNQLGSSTATFSNQAGQNFSVNQLATQLQNLRTAVEQTLPALAAFNENYSNSVSGGNGSVSGLLSRALNRNQPASTTPGQNPSTFDNVVNALANLMTTNRTHQGAVPENTGRDLATLQSDLQPVLAILNQLNISGLSPNQFASPENPTLQSTNSLSPTGR
jgi:hypothetical protein